MTNMFSFNNRLHTSILDHTLYVCIYVLTSGKQELSFYKETNGCFPKYIRDQYITVSSRDEELRGETLHSCR